MDSLQVLPESRTRLQSLSVRHREAISLICQGVKRTEVGQICGFEPEYVSWIMRQEVAKEYLKEMNEVVDFRLQALTEESVDTIAEVMKTGAGDERLKAAKLQLESIGRIGAGKNAMPLAQSAPDHLEQLAQRLVSLVKKAKEGVIIDVEVQTTEG